jgi:hypothetical protein
MFVTIVLRYIKDIKRLLKLETLIEDKTLLFKRFNVDVFSRLVRILDH